MATRRDIRKRNERARAERSSSRKRAGGIRHQTGVCATAGYKKWHLSRDAGTLANELREYMRTGKRGPAAPYSSFHETVKAWNAIHDGEIKDELFEAHLHMLPAEIVEGTAYSTAMNHPDVSRPVAVTTFCEGGRLQSYLHMDGEFPPFNLHTHEY